MFYLFLIFSFLTSVDVFSRTEKIFVQTVYENNTFKVEELEMPIKMSSFDVGKYLSFNNTPEGLKVLHVNFFSFTCHIPDIRCVSHAFNQKYALSKLLIQRKTHFPNRCISVDFYDSSYVETFVEKINSVFGLIYYPELATKLKKYLNEYPTIVPDDMKSNGCVFGLKNLLKEFFKELLQKHDCIYRPYISEENSTKSSNFSLDFNPYEN